MSADQINAEIAQACGWNHAAKNYSPMWWHDDHMGSFLAPPHYSTSLDVMATAEATLSDDEKNDYQEILTDIVMGKPSGIPCPVSLTFFILSATAAQRAEAFLAVKKSGGAS